MKTRRRWSWPLILAAAACAGGTPWKELPAAPGYTTASPFAYQTAQFRKVDDVVCLRGLIRKEGPPPIAPGTVVALLPEGFRPPGAVGFATRGSDQSPHPDKIDVSPNGNVIVRVSSAQDASFVILDGICFSTTSYRPDYS